MTEAERQKLLDLIAYNEDWIKTPENRESERLIHNRLAKEHRNQ